MAFCTLNGKVACTPFEKRGLEIETKKGFATVKNKAELVPLKVVMLGHVMVGTKAHEVDVGVTVWVRGEMVKAAWAGEEFEVGGKKFILVPCELIVLAESND